ncbi:ABC transporter ATP-binding protein [archaeon]|nr:ABC transporter ATP-binding protein [archaeon]
MDLKNVSMSFFENNSEFKIIDDISFSVKDGEFICILGPSGCGKTILLYLLAGFLKQTKGKILFLDKEIIAPSPERMMVFQNYVLFPWRTVSENISFALENSNLSKKEKEKTVNKYISLVGLDYFKEWNIHKLSGGMQQRVSIARALVVDPKLLLMDEPLSALDNQYRKHLREEIEKIWLKTKKTVIFVTHSINEALYLADRIYLLSPRPAKIKKIYNLKHKRPRKLNSLEIIKLREDIEKEMKEDFIKTKESDFVSNDMENKILNVKL